jgi:fluoride ion exporter CrcB/FEX
MRDINGVARSPGDDVRELAWTVAGASAGNVVRHLIDPIWPSSARNLADTFVLAAVAAALIGFALVACIRVSMRTVLFAAGGAAGSISAVATRAAAATPAQSGLVLAAFFAGAVIGVLSGMFIALAVAKPKRAERY